MAYFSYGQTEEVKIWKNSHPNILLIEESDANDEFLNLLEAKGQTYIVYNDRLTLNDITVYKEKNTEFVSNLSITEKNEIKIWKANHPKVMILSAEEFNLLPLEKQQILFEKNVLVYQGEELILTDLNTYDEK